MAGGHGAARIARCHTPGRPPHPTLPCATQVCRAAAQQSVCAVVVCAKRDVLRLRAPRAGGAAALHQARRLQAHPGERMRARMRHAWAARYAGHARARIHPSMHPCTAWMGCCGLHSHIDHSAKRPWALAVLGTMRAACMPPHACTQCTHTAWDAPPPTPKHAAMPPSCTCACACRRGWRRGCAGSATSAPTSLAGAPTTCSWSAGWR